MSRGKMRYRSKEIDPGIESMLSAQKWPSYDQKN